MAKRLQTSSPGEALTGLAKSFMPDPYKAALIQSAGATAEKTRQDAEKLRATNEADAKFRVAIQAPRGTYTPSQLMALAAHNPALMAEVPKAYLLGVVSDPTASQHDRAIAAQAAGLPYGSTEEGDRYNVDQRTRATLGAASIGAGPHYYSANLEHKDREARLAQDQQHWTDTPVDLLNADTGQSGFARQGDLPTQYPVGSGFSKFAPETYKAAGTGVPVGGGPGQPNTLLPFSKFAGEGRRDAIYLAPTPDTVLSEDQRLRSVIAPGAKTPQLITEGQIKQYPPLTFTDPTKTGEGAERPQADKLSAQDSYHNEALLRQEFTRRAGLKDFGYLGDAATRVAPRALPADVEKDMPGLKSEINTLTQNRVDPATAIDQVLTSHYGKNFSITTPSLWGSDTLVRDLPGTQAAPTVQRDQQGRPLVQPQSKTDTVVGAQPTVLPPPSPASVLAPPVPPVTYLPASPATTVQPPPATVAAPKPPAPPPPPAAPAAPQLSKADAFSQAQLAIQAGKDPAAVRSLLQGMGYDPTEAGL